MRPVLVKDFSPLVIQASHWTRSATLNARFTLMSSGCKYFGPSAFLPSESFCCLFALSQFLTLLFPTSYHRLIKAKLPCSSSISFSNSQIDRLQLESCIICISPCLCHDEGDKMTTVIRMMGSLSALDLRHIMWRCSVFWRHESCESGKNPQISRVIV